MTLLLCGLILFEVLEARGGRGGGGGRAAAAARPATINRSPSLSRSAPSAAPRSGGGLTSPSLSQGARSGSSLSSPSPANVRSRVQTQQQIAQNIRGNISNLPASTRDNVARIAANRRLDNYADWAGASSWLGYGWNEPYYYDDGSYYSAQDYSQAYAPAQPQAQPQPQQAAPQTVATPVNNTLPLGVFAITDAKGASTPTMYLQLSLTQQGTLEGTFYNSSLNTTYPLTGYIDQPTQAARWKIATYQNSPIMETGVYNLTQDQTSAQLFFPNGQIQNWMLVRVKS